MSSDNIRLFQYPDCGCISEYAPGRCSQLGPCSPCDDNGNLFSVEYRQIEGQVSRVNVYASRPIIDADREIAAIRKNQEAHGIVAPVVDAEEAMPK